MSVNAAASVAEPWTLQPPCRRYVLRAEPAQLANVAAAYGWPAPGKMLRARVAGSRASLWLGPDEWLLLDVASASGEAAALPLTVPHSWVEVSDRQVALELTGPKAVELLASACPLDLAPEIFAVNHCTRTVFGRAEITLWWVEAERYRLECWRSFLPYVQSLLRAAS